MRIVIVGMGAAGMFASLLLARSGNDVVALEQHGLELAPDVESAALRAHRPSAPQIMAPHLVMARCRELLVERLPDVHRQLLSAGAVEVALSDRMPPSLPDCAPWPGDGRLATVATRRSTLDWVLAGAVRLQRGIELRSDVRVLGLCAIAGRVPRVCGVRTDRGDINADLVVDATGRRSPIERWLTSIGAHAPASSSAECGVTYFSRHYRLRPSARLPGPPTTRLVDGLEEFTLALFGGDNSTMQLAVVPLADDRRFWALSDPEAYEGVLRTVPAYRAWLEVLDPITPIFRMVAPPNSLRRLVVDGRPVATGLHAVGDSVCTTNPTFGRGLSLAMWGAADLADTLSEHGDDLTQQALVLDQHLADHLAPYYDEQAAVDATRLAALRHAVFGEPAPEPPPTAPGVAEHIDFAQLRAAAPFHPTAFRAFWRLMGMLALPSDIYTDPQIVASIRQTLPPYAHAERPVQYDDMARACRHGRRAGGA